MTSLHRLTPPVHAAFPFEVISGDCSHHPRTGKVCSQLHPDRPVLWCEACRDELAGEPIPSPAPSPEPDDLATYFDGLAAAIRAEGHGASALASAILEREAREVRVLRAATAADYEARCEVLALESQLALAGLDDAAGWPGF